MQRPHSILCASFAGFRTEGLLLPLDRISVLTNGTLVDEETIRVFKETRPTVGVSIDGPQYLHDAERVDERGRGAFNAASRGYNNYKMLGSSQAYPAR